MFHKTSEGHPENVEIGDRFVCIVTWAENFGPPLPHVAVLVAVEDGWESDDDWTMDDTDWWAREQDVLELAKSPA